MKYSLGNSRVTCNGDCWIADNATVVGSVILENNASIWFNCVVRADNDTIRIGENSQLQDGCILHVDPGFPIKLGRNVSIGHMAMLHGCTIGDGTLIGIKSIVLNGAQIGRNCVIGANSLITEGKKIPDGSLVLGSPGKVVRALSDHEIRLYNSFADDYVARWKQYRAELKADPQP
jgi:carbonic anhydrase/acetyltransferase-like protein (isoleucine patch superfamily)